MNPVPVIVSWHSYRLTVSNPVKYTLHQTPSGGTWHQPMERYPFRPMRILQARSDAVTPRPIPGRIVLVRVKPIVDVLLWLGAVAGAQVSDA